MILICLKLIKKFGEVFEIKYDKIKEILKNLFKGKKIIKPNFSEDYNVINKKRKKKTKK